MSEMDWRHYDPFLGRFNAVDKLAETTYRASAYTFANNNPIRFGDPSGLKAVYNWTTGQYNDGDRVVSFDEAMASNGVQFYSVDASTAGFLYNAISNAYGQLSGASVGGGLIPTGRITFVGLTKSQLKNFSIIPEDFSKDSPLITPNHNGTYEGDGFYFKNPTDSAYWYKVSAGGEVTVEFKNGEYQYGEYWNEAYSVLASIIGREYFVGFMPKNKDHWIQNNPFDNKK